MADFELATIKAWMTIFLILGGHLSMSRTWAHPLFCSFSDSSTFIRNMPWMHFFEASSNIKHNIQILQHATQSLPIPGTLQHLDLTLCHSLTVHIIHQVNLISQFLKKILCSSVSWKNSSYSMGICSTPAIHFDLSSHIPFPPLCTYLYLMQPAPFI